MAPKQRMRFANEKASKNVVLRGNVPKSSVSFLFTPNHIVLIDDVYIWKLFNNGLKIPESAE